MSIVEVKNIQRNYQQGEHIVRALRGVDLAIQKGEFTALMGPSGSGKTTLLNIIGGLDKPNEGEVRIDGQDLSALSAGELSDLRLHKLGFVFQAYNLIPVLTAYQIPSVLSKSYQDQTLAINHAQHFLTLETPNVP